MKRKGVQILEEALLVIMAFIGLSIALGLLSKVGGQIQGIFSEIWKALDYLLKTMFYWLPQ